MHRGGGNRLASHIKEFNLIRLFNNLALWGENKFVSEQERTYKFKRGGYCHTENNSPKYLIVSKIKGNNFTDKVHSLFTTHHSLRKTAFTLAEVLVTLGIIGVVSAMTVPTLMQNYQRQSYVTQLHKTYNEFSQALLRYQADRNAINLSEAGLSSQDAVNNFITTYFKNVKECDTMNNCFASSYKAMNGGTLNNSYVVNVKSYVFASGVSIRPLYDKSGAKLVNIGIDINGQKGPNIGGRDLFWFYVYNNGVIDDAPIDANTVAPMTTEQRNTQFNAKCLNHEGSPDGCFGKILNDNWQMTY